MKKLENAILSAKMDIDMLEVPEELEQRLKNSLAKAGRSRKPVWKLAAVAACILLLLIGYNMDTLAYYGRKLVGYDNVMNGTLKQLNELEKGQIINKSFTFSNGVSVTLDGVMLDDNQLLAFYTVKDPSGNIEDVHLSATYMNGFFGSHITGGGMGEVNKEKTEIKWITEFEPPYFFEKTLSFELSLTVNNAVENGEIVFALDRSKAMGHTLRKGLDLKLDIDNSTICFNSIAASPTKTVLKGTIQSAFELAKNKAMGERLYPRSINVKLYANGKELASQGGGISTGATGIRFEAEFDALPEKLDSLKLMLTEFIAGYETDFKVKLSTADMDKSLQIHGQEIVVNKVEVSGENTYVTITSEDSTVLSSVYLMADGNKAELKNTTTANKEKLADGKILHTRTLSFPGKGAEYTMVVDRIAYSKAYNELLEIPLD
ncbi:MAG: DUF4179 domain-containing protein [Bacillota bacterium]